MRVGGVRCAGRGVARLCTSVTIPSEVHRRVENGFQHPVKNSYRGAQVRSAGCGVRGGLAPRPLAALAPRAVLTWAFRRACAPLAGAGPGRPHAQNERDGAGVQQGPYPNGAPGVRYTTKHSSGRAPEVSVYFRRRAGGGGKEGAVLADPLLALELRASYFERRVVAGTPSQWDWATIRSDLV